MLNRGAKGRIAEVSHQQSFEKALYSIQPCFPPGKLPPMKELSNVYFNWSAGGQHLRNRTRP